MSSTLKAALVVVLAALIGGGGAAIALGLRTEPEDRSPHTARSLAQEADRALAASLTDLGTATDLDTLLAAGRSAHRRAAVTRALLDRTDRIGEPRYRAAARGVIEADVAALTAIAQLSDARNPTSTTTRRLLADATRVQDGLQRAAEHWPRAVDARAAVGPPTVFRVDESVTTVTRRLRRVERRLRTWRVRVAQVRRSRKARAGVLDAYGSSFRTYHRDYQEMRDYTETFIARTDRSGSTFDAAYDFLGDAIADRARIRRGLDALDAPTALAGAHNRVVASLDTAIEAMGDAYDGIVDYQFDGEAYDSYKDTPGWRRFAAKSDALAGSYAANFADWGRRLKRARRAITDKPLPARPDV